MAVVDADPVAGATGGIEEDCQRIDSKCPLRIVRQIVERQGGEDVEKAFDEAPGEEAAGLVGRAAERVGLDDGPGVRS